MRIVKSVVLLLGLLTVGAAVSETPQERWSAEYEARLERLFMIEDRLTATHPYPRRSPSREDNIRDEEVRQIQGVMSEVFPGAIVNIATVVTGCECEDGPSCTDQVWVIGWRPSGSKGLLLSKIDGNWRVGPVQQWWLDYEKFQSRNFPSSSDYYDAEKAFKERFPACLELSRHAQYRRKSSPSPPK